MRLTASRRRAAAVAVSTAFTMLATGAVAADAPVGPTSDQPPAARSTARAVNPDSTTVTVTPGSAAVKHVNRQRRKRGLVPLRMIAKPRRAAIGHSRYQASIGRMTHLGRSGGDAGDRLTHFGYRWRMWGENVAAGYHLPGRVVRAWMHSPGHRANLLARRARHVGVARVAANDGTYYWTLVVADR